MIDKKVRKRRKFRNEQENEGRELNDGDKHI